ncbi:MAG: hypothetical protein HY252_04360 [Sphingobacteriales bacterium]|nr:hypothetical protein [Sphingobacteriales bacterium]
MRQATIYIFLFFVSLISVNSRCHKTDVNPCAGKTKPDGKFLIKEIIGDTAFTADTIFRDNYVQFNAVNSYETVSWKIGSDPRTFTDSSFYLSFITALGTLPVNFTGKKTANPTCFPGDNGIYSSSQNFTIVEQVEKPNVTISPLVGRYKGYFTDSPNDIFTVRMEYFDSTKYDVTMTGSKNFYWFSNYPNGYASTLNSAYAYPELKTGVPIEMGYKCFHIYLHDSKYEGYGWLSHDTLFINSGNSFEGRKKFIGKRL